MAVWRFVNLDIPEAKPLADLNGIKIDLEATIEICDLLLTEIGKTGKKPPNFMLQEALMSAALVRFVRSFGKGVRKVSHDSLFEGLTEEERADKNYFKDLRDKYIAHSVNPFEDNQVVAYLVPEERGPRGVSSVSVQHSRMVSIGGDEVSRLKTLSEALLGKLNLLIEDEEKEVLAAARSLPVDDLYKQEDPPPKFPTRRDAKKWR